MYRSSGAIYKVAGFQNYRPAQGAKMKIGGLYTIADDYFTRFPFRWVLRNHTEGRTDNLGFRPHVIAFRDQYHKEIYWAVPLSQNVPKYKAAYNSHVDKYGSCDTIAIVRTKGSQDRTTALMQNMIPVTKRYIAGEYKDMNTGRASELRTSDRGKVLALARGVLGKHRHGTKVIYSNADEIYDELKSDLMIERGVKAIKASPLVAHNILVKEDERSKITVALVSEKGKGIPGIFLMQIEERQGEPPQVTKIPITAEHFARTVKDFEQASWDKATLRSQQKAASRDTFADKLDKAEDKAKNASSAQKPSTRDDWVR